MVALAHAYSLQQVDIMSGALTLGHCHGDKPEEFSGCFFGATGFTGATPAPGIGARMSIDGFMLPLGPVIGGMFALALTKKNRDDTRCVGGITPSYFVGYGGKIPGFGEVRLGHLDNASQAGLYTNLTVTRIRGFPAAARTDGLKNVPFLNTGFRDLMPGGEELAEKIGSSTLSARKLDFSPPTASWHRTATQRRQHVDRAPAPGQHGQAHRGRRRRRLPPSTFLHELSVGVHTPNFAVPTGPDGKPFWKAEGGGAAAIHGGMVELPKLPYYGVTGGRSAYLAIALEARSMSDKSDVRVRVGVRRNAPEVLVAFPLAQNAFNFHMQVAGGFQGKRERPRPARYPRRRRARAVGVDPTVDAGIPLA